MQLVKLEQRTDEWAAWRREGITASETPVILGISPYKTPWRLWAEKTGLLTPPDMSGNPHVARGVLLEDAVRERYAEETLDIVEPACGVFDADPIFRASFDGLDSLQRPVEIKCPSEAVFRDVLQNGENSLTFKLYRAQVQHQMLVAEAQKGFLVFYCDGEMKVFEIDRDEAMIARILSEGRKFFELVRTKTEPPKDPERDVYIPKETSEIERWVKAARLYAGAEEAIHRLKSQIEALKAQQKEAVGVFKELMQGLAFADFAGISVRRSAAKGRIDFKAALEAASPGISEAELEKFRGAPSERWTFSVNDRSLPKGFDNEALAKAVQSVPEEKRWF